MASHTAQAGAAPPLSADTAPTSDQLADQAAPLDALLVDAAIHGRSYVLPDDIKALAEPVLAHRIILRPNAEMQGQSAGKLVAGLLEREHVPQMAYDG